MRATARVLPVAGVTGTVVAIAGLVKDYQGLRPLRVKSLDVGRGERVAIAGFDRTAAEVFVNLLNGAILPDEGEVRLFGRPTSDLRDEDDWLTSLERLGIVTPRAVLLEQSTIEQNLALPFTLDIDELPEDARERVRELAAEVGLAGATLGEPAAKAPAASRMRIHLARALALAPDLLVLEHPTLDVPRPEVTSFAQSIRKIAAARDLTVVAITDDDEFAAIVAERRLKQQPGTGVLVPAGGWRRWLL